MLNNFSQAFLSAVEEAPVIVLYRHVFPDPDALGSQLGLKMWLETAYPEKQIYAAGEGMDDLSSVDCSKALAIITDTSNASRVDGDGFQNAKSTIRIDHHVKVEDLADLDYVDDHAAAACELVALMLKQLNQTIPQEAAQELMKGLMADTQRFTISTVRPETFEAAAWLLEQKADPVAASASLFTHPYSNYTYGTFVRTKATRKKDFLFALVSASEYLSQGIGFSQAKERVDCLAGVSDIQIWALFTQMEDGIHYSASLRSRTIPIRDLAAAYGGGGHECASGIKNLTIAQVSELIEKLADQSLLKA